MFVLGFCCGGTFVTALFLALIVWSLSIDEDTDDN